MWLCDARFVWEKERRPVMCCEKCIQCWVQLMLGCAVPWGQAAMIDLSLVTEVLQYAQASIVFRLCNRNPGRKGLVRYPRDAVLTGTHSTLAIPGPVVHCLYFQATQIRIRWRQEECMATIVLRIDLEEFEFNTC